ncbi:MAG: hypothetical protein QG674_55 [Patescibacteria group bacterium]|jgi:hypothetical protein|nr:hypothetical protein [Patescibacteria group bacterium]
MEVENEKVFNFTKKANMLFWAGIVGIGLSITYLWASIGFGDNPPPVSLTLPYVFYFVFNSALLILSGIFLQKKKKIGLITFLLSVVSILISFFIKIDNTNLFFHTIGMALLGTLLVFPPIGTIFFFYSIINNLFDFKKWKNTIIK